MSYDILIVDDEKDICSLIADILDDEGYSCRVAHSGTDAMEKVKDRLPSLVLQDIWLGESSFDGIKVLEQIKEINADIPVVMMSGHGTIETAVNALKKGAYDFLEKPFNSTRLLILIEKALENSRLKMENVSLKETQETKDDVLIGSSDTIKTICKTIEKVASTNSRVVLSGPNGVGKGTIAKHIHDQSQRSQFPFKTLNCMGLSPDELEKSLFGFEDGGKFSPGLFEQANGGTLFLKCVNEMSKDTQSLLVKALTNQRFKRQGGDAEVPVDVRVIASSTVDLQKLIDHDLFREDLYYRLNVVSIEVPPLGERTEDIPLLAKHFLSIFRNQDSQPFSFSAAALMELKSQPWPGNIRELRNLIEFSASSLMESKQSVIEVTDLPSRNGADKSASDKPSSTFLVQELTALPLKAAREQFETAYLQEQLSRFEGNISKIAEFIGMERSALHRKLKALEIPKDAVIKEAS